MKKKKKLRNKMTNTKIQWNIFKLKINFKKVTINRKRSNFKKKIIPNLKKNKSKPLNINKILKFRLDKNK